MKQPRRKDVDVAVPKTGGHDEALAVNYSRTARDLDPVTWSNRLNVAAVYKDGAVFDGWFRWGEIDFRTHQGQVGGVALASPKESQNHEKRSCQPDSHS
jgi:hypothetical protein